MNLQPLHAESFEVTLHDSCAQPLMAYRADPTLENRATLTERAQKFSQLTTRFPTLSNYQQSFYLAYAAGLTLPSPALPAEGIRKPFIAWLHSHLPEAWHSPSLAALIAHLWFEPEAALTQTLLAQTCSGLRYHGDGFSLAVYFDKGVLPSTFASRAEPFDPEQLYRWLSPFPALVKELKLYQTRQQLFTAFDQHQQGIANPTPEELAQTVNYLEQLGDYYAQLAQDCTHPHWQDMVIFANTFYQACLRQAASASERVAPKILALEQHLLSAYGQTAVSWPWTKGRADRKKLANYRQRFKAELAEAYNLPIKTEEQALARAHAIHVLTQEVVRFIKQFVSGLTQSCEDKLGVPPCTYALIGLGSLDKHTMTPYSDFEFALLIEEDTEAHRAYFRQLSYLLNLRFLHLRESPLPFSLFNYSFDKFTHTGFCFDLGGKVSLGRWERHDVQSYELIGNPEKLLNYISDDHFTIDKFLPIELARCTHVHGSQSLTTDYQQRCATYLKALDLDGQPRYRARALYLLDKDLETHDPGLGGINKLGNLFNVKKEIYRLPDCLLEALGLYFGHIGGSVWDKVEKLAEDEAIPRAALPQCQLMIGFANALRAQVYSFYGQQSEAINLILRPENEEQAVPRQIYQATPSDIEAIRRYYFSAIATHKLLTQFLKKTQSNSHQAACEWLHQPKARWHHKTLVLQADIAQRLGQPKQALNYLQRDKKSQVSPEGLQKLALAADLSGKTTLAKGYCQKLLVTQEEHYGLDHWETAITLVNLATAEGQLGHTQEQKRLLRRTLPIFKQHYGPNHWQTAVVLGNLAVVEGELGRSEAQKRLLHRALTMEEQHYGPNHWKTAGTLANLANAEGALGHTQEQKRLLRRALAIQEEHYGPNHWQTANTLVNLANAEGQLGHTEEQKRLLRRALPIFKQHYGPDHWQTASTLGSLATAEGALGHTEEAKRLLRRALTIKEEHYGPDHWKTATTLVNLANAEGTLGHTEEKKCLLRRALTIQEEHYGPNHWQTASTLVNLANAEGTLDHTEKKKRLLRRALVIQEEHYGPDHWQTGITLVNLANAEGALGHTEEQKRLLRRALAIKEGHYGPDHWQNAITLVNLANAEEALGHTEEQKRLLRQALPLSKQHYGPDSQETTYLLAKLAHIAAQERDCPKQQCLQQALASSPAAALVAQSVLLSIDKGKRDKDEPDDGRGEVKTDEPRYGGK